MPEEKNPTHKDLARKLKVSETTIKSYRKKFSEFIPVHSRGKPIRFKPEALDVCRSIRDGFGRDLSVPEVRDMLAEDFPLVHPEAVAARSEQEKAGPGPEGEARALRGLAARLEEQEQRLARMEGLLEKLAANIPGEPMESGTNTRDLAELKAHVAATLQDAMDQGMHKAAEDAVAQVLDKGLLQAVSPTAQEAAATEPAEAGSDKTLGLEDTRRKRVRVTNAYGHKSEYLFETEAGPQEVHEPDKDFLELPLVVRSGRDEFLGVAGRATGPFSLNDFAELTARAHSEAEALDLEWGRDEENKGWVLTTRQPDTGQVPYVFHVRQLTTPRGNQVVELHRLEQDGTETPPTSLYAVIKRLRERLEEK